MTERPVPVRTAAGWLIPFGDGALRFERSEHSLALLVGSGISIIVEGMIQIRTGTHMFELEPSSEEVDEALRGAGKVTHLEVLDSGLLEMQFTTSMVVNVAPDAHYESFQLYEVGPQLARWPSSIDGSSVRWDDNRQGRVEGSSLSDQFVFIGLPGGGISSFTSRQH